MTLSKNKIMRMQMKDHHDRILTRALYPFHILTGEQVTDVLYSPGSLKRVKGYLKELTDTEYIQAFPVPLGSGQPPFAYALAEKGKKWLKTEHGLEVPFVYRATMANLHTLELNKFLIAAKNLEKVAPLRPHGNPVTSEMEDMPAVFVADIRHDFDLKAEPIKTTTREGRTVSIVPDALLDIQVRFPNTRKRNRRVVVIELERDTHRTKPFAEKLQDYIDVIRQEALQTYLKTYNFLICYVSTIGMEHVEKMQRITREVLVKNFGQIHPASDTNTTFHFAAIPPLRGKPIDIASTFLKPYWYVPFGEKDARYQMIDWNV
jgi:hypothetical protein